MLAKPSEATLRRTPQPPQPPQPQPPQQQPQPQPPRACLSPSALAYEGLRMTCTYARPGLTAAPTAARLQVQDVRIHPQQWPHHLGACRLDRGRIGCGLHPCEWRCPLPPRSPSSLQWPQCEPYISVPVVARAFTMPLVTRHPRVVRP